MRNLLNFILKHNFIILFVFLEIIAIFLLIQFNYYHRSAFISSANIISGNFLKTINQVFSYFQLREKNKILAEENAYLHTFSPASFLKYYVHDEQIINDTLYKQQYKYIPAEVINNSVNRRNNYLTLNKGRLHGVQEEMGVISSQGIVGIVKNVSKHFCTVLSVLHKDARISAKLKNNEYKGELSWNGEDYKYASLNYIEKHVKINIGDTVVTSGFSVIFPKNIMIGVIENFELNKGENFYKIKVKLSTDFKKLSHVYIIKNLLKDEQLELEEKTIQSE